MAVTPITISDTELEGNLKNVYTDIRNELLPISTPLLAQIKKVGRKNSVGAKWGGNGLFFDVVLDGEYNANFSGSGYLPQSMQAPEKQGSVTPKRIYVRRAFDNFAMVGTQTKEAAFESLRRKVTGAFSKALDFALEENLNGNALGIKAVLSSSADTTHFVATSPWGLASSGQGGLFIRRGMYIAVVANDGTTVRGRAVVSSVSNSGDNVTVTLASAISGMIGTDFVVGATESDIGYNQSCNGLQNLLNIGGSYDSLHGIDASTYPVSNTLRFAAGTDTDSVTDVSDMDLWNLATKLGAKCGIRPLVDTSDFFWHSTYGLQKKFIESYLANTNVTIKTGEKVDINGGYKATMIHGIPFVANEYARAGAVDLIHKPSINWFDASDWSAVEYEGSGKIRWIDGRDAFETSMKSYFNVFTPQRNAHATITGYTDTVRYTNVV